MTEGEMRLVPMVEVLNLKGEVVRYAYPRGYRAETWWEAGITAEEAEKLANNTDMRLDEYLDVRDDPTVAKIRAPFAQGAR